MRTRLAYFLGRNRRHIWAWPVLGLWCDISRVRAGKPRCLGWVKHRDMA